MANIVDKQLGNRIRQLRTRNGVSARDAASACRMDVSTYESCEAGLSRFAAMQLFNLSVALNVSMTEIFSDLEV